METLTKIFNEQWIILIENKGEKLKFSRDQGPENAVILLALRSGNTHEVMVFKISFFRKSSQSEISEEINSPSKSSKNLEIVILVYLKSREAELNLFLWLLIDNYRPNVFFFLNLQLLVGINCLNIALIA